MKTTQSQPPATSGADVAHTPLPWTVVHEDEDSVFIDAQKAEDCDPQWCVAVPQGSRAKANAAFIVRACNSHAALVAALNGALSAYQIRVDIAERMGVQVPTKESWVPKARAALQSVEDKP